MSLFYAAASSGGPQDGLAGFFVKLMDQMGLVGAAIAVGADNLFPPIPSEVILPLAGFAAAQGVFSLEGVLVATTVGSVVGAIILYWIGRGFGRERMVWVFRKTPLLKVSDLEKTEAWFDKHGYKAVLFGRMIPLFRSLISVPAGVEKMNFLVFVLLTTIGSAIWNAIWVVAGYKLGSNWEQVEPFASVFQKIVIVLVAVALVAFVVVRVREKMRIRRARGDE